MTTTTINGVTVRRVSTDELRAEVGEAVHAHSGLTLEEFLRLGREGRLEGYLRDLWLLYRESL